jgi:hypothetical protein
MNYNMEYKGNLKGFPKEVVDKMLEEQANQGNETNVSVFEDDGLSCRKMGGFDWDKTKDREDFWDDVIRCKNFETFFEKYPKYNLVFPRKMLVHNRGEQAEERTVIAYLDGIEYPYIAKVPTVRNTYTGYQYAIEIDEDVEPEKEDIVAAIDRLIDVLSKYTSKSK